MSSFPFVDDGANFRPPGLPAVTSDDELAEAIRLWLCGGDKDSLAEILHVPRKTINLWINTREWQAGARFLAPEVHALVGGSLNRLKTQTLEQLADRIENGDYRMDNTGEVVGRVPMKGRDLIEVFAKVSDAQVQLEKMIGSIKDDDDATKIDLYKLALGLKRFAEAKEIVGETAAQSAN